MTACGGAVLCWGAVVGGVSPPDVLLGACDPPLEVEPRAAGGAVVGVLLAEAGVAWAPGMARATKADTAATAATTPTARALVSRVTRARAASRRRA
ncbi:MAG: hypothetical protein J2P59_05735, partial [Acidimicrobiales bacterium]|nr:hypothetical protein [Acidimicrobiales bacterium]